MYLNQNWTHMDPTLDIYGDGSSVSSERAEEPGQLPFLPGCQPSRKRGSCEETWVACHILRRPGAGGQTVLRICGIT